MKNEEVELAFEEVLSDNPWLMNPTWEVRKSLQSQSWLDLVHANNDNPERVRTDIILEVIDEPFPIIIELKREKATGYSAPNSKEVVNQIQDYRTAIAQKLTLDSIGNLVCQLHKLKRTSFVEVKQWQN